MLIKMSDEKDNCIFLKQNEDLAEIMPIIKNCQFVIFAMILALVIYLPLWEFKNLSLNDRYSTLLLMDHIHSKNVSIIVTKG